MKESVKWLVLVTNCLHTTVLANDYYGTYVGDFQNRFHGVSGEVYAVDSRTLFIKDFRWLKSGLSEENDQIQLLSLFLPAKLHLSEWANILIKEIFFVSYDGQGPDAYFYAGERGQPSRNGYLIANEKGSTDILGRYNKKDIVLTLPGGRTLKNIK